MRMKEVPKQVAKLVYCGTSFCISLLF